MVERENRVLRKYALPQASGIISSIINPIVKANNFELSHALVTFVERAQLGGHPSNNPNIHMHKFLAKCNTIKFNEVSTDAIRLRLFPFSPRDGVSNYM